MRSVHLTSATLAANSSGGGSAAVVQLLIFGLIGLAMYFLLIRPQKRRQRAAVSLQQSIEVGDEVMTTSGLYGFVTGFEGDIAWIEIDDNVQIRVARQAIQRKVDTSKGETGGAPADDGTKSRQTKIDESTPTPTDPTSSDEA
jgi:preprotein translocase subunit YajC